MSWETAPAHILVLDHYKIWTSSDTSHMREHNCPLACGEVTEEMDHKDSNCYYGTNRKGLIYQDEIESLVSEVFESLALAQQQY